jgi:hypothetical protein
MEILHFLILERVHRVRKFIRLFDLDCMRIEQTEKVYKVLGEIEYWEGIPLIIL